MDRTRVRALVRFIRFSLVGVVGFVVDSVTLEAALAIGSGPYIGQIIAYAVAATGTWWLNRRFTFRSQVDGKSREWARYITANFVGGLVNYSVFASGEGFIPLVRDHPLLGVAAGSLSGLAVNFSLSSRYVFAPRRRPEDVDQGSA